MTAKSDLSNALQIAQQEAAISQAIQMLTTSTDAIVNVEVVAPGFTSVRVLGVSLPSLKGQLQAQLVQLQAQLASLGVT